MLYTLYQSTDIMDEGQLKIEIERIYFWIKQEISGEWGNNKVYI